MTRLDGVEAVLLDMGGVILEMKAVGGIPGGRLDHRGREALLRRLRAEGRRLTSDDLASWLFDPWRRDYERRYQTLVEGAWEPHLEELRRRSGSELDDLEILAEWFRPYGEFLVAVEGAREALDSITTAGHRLGLVSNVPLPGELYRRRLEDHGLVEPFDDLRFSYDQGSRKPSPAMVRASLSALGVRPERAVMVGDRRRADVAAGRTAGVRTVWIRSDDGGGPEADFTIDSIRDLPSLLA